MVYMYVHVFYNIGAALESLPPKNQQSIGGSGSSRSCSADEEIDEGDERDDLEDEGSAEDRKVSQSDRLEANGMSNLPVSKVSVGPSDGVASLFREYLGKEQRQKDPYQRMVSLILAVDPLQIGDVESVIEYMKKKGDLQGFQVDHCEIEHMHTT